MLGYSLGGRLALHACLSRPDLWDAAIVVGADPGLESQEEKKLQLDRDRNWAERLKRKPLERLLDEWDAQSVFCGIENQAPRNLGEMDPDTLSQQFEVFSKGLQQNLVPKLAELGRPPVLFVSGEKDQKYKDIGEKLAKSSSVVTAQIVVNAGHRVPWENPESFVQVLIDFALVECFSFLWTKAHENIYETSNLGCGNHFLSLIIFGTDAVLVSLPSIRILRVPVRARWQKA